MASRTTPAREVLVKNVERLLRKKKMNRTELARGIGKSQPQISQVLNGKRAFSLGVLDDLASVFEVPVASLFMDAATGLESAGLTEDEQDLMAAFREADTRTRRAIATLLEPPDAQKPTAVPVDPAQAIADILVRAGQLAAGGGPRGVSSPGPDRRSVAGASHRRPTRRDS